MIDILRKNKGVIIFYIVLAIATLVLVNDIKMENLKETKETLTYINK